MSFTCTDVHVMDVFRQRRVLFSCLRILQGNEDLVVSAGVKLHANSFCEQCRQLTKCRVWVTHSLDVHSLILPSNLLKRWVGQDEPGGEDF